MNMKLTFFFQSAQRCSVLLEIFTVIPEEVSMGQTYCKERF